VSYENMNPGAVRLLGVRLLAVIASNASNVEGLLRQGAFAVCRRWIEILKREPASWRNLRLTDVSNSLVSRLLEFTKTALNLHGRYHFQHIEFYGGIVTDVGVECLAKNSLS
jgi:hypothetical protein